MVKKSEIVDAQGRYHTDSLEYPPVHRSVYHTNQACKRGSEIKKKHRIGGLGVGRKLCELC
jgi:hypothetical protein